MTQAKTETKPQPKIETIKCEVLRGIGMPPDDKTLKTARERARRKDIEFDPTGLTTMVFPNKPEYENNGKKVIEPKPVFVDLDKATAKKLQKVGAVRVVI